MERDELIGKMQMVYIGDKRAMNELIDYYDKLHNKIDKAIEYINIVGIKTDKPKYFQMIKDTIWGEELLEILQDSDVDE